MYPLHRDSLEFAFVPYSNIISPVENEERVLKCLCLVATDDELDHSVNFNMLSYDTIEAVKWYVFVAISSVLYVHHIVRSN